MTTRDFHGFLRQFLIVVIIVMGGASHALTDSRIETANSLDGENDAEAVRLLAEQEEFMKPTERSSMNMHD
jgi:hypothetical protein